MRADADALEDTDADGDADVEPETLATADFDALGVEAAEPDREDDCRDVREAREEVDAERVADLDLAEEAVLVRAADFVSHMVVGSDDAVSVADVDCEGVSLMELDSELVSSTEGDGEGDATGDVLIAGVATDVPTSVATPEPVGLPARVPARVALCAGVPGGVGSAVGDGELSRTGEYHV